MLFASQHVMPQRLIPWLTVLSGALVAGMGVWLLVRRLSSNSGHNHGHQHHGHSHPHDHGLVHSHEPDHPHDHAHGNEDVHQRGAFGHHTHGLETSGPPPVSNTCEVSLGSLLSLGISGGLVPCPEALVVLLIAIALNKVTLGLVILLSFSVGLASVLVAIGILLVVAKPIVTRFTGEGKIFSYLPVASAAIIILLGCGIAVKGLLEAGIL